MLLEKIYQKIIEAAIVLGDPHKNLAGLCASATDTPSKRGQGVEANACSVSVTSSPHHRVT
jgi:hypothetical protein